MFTLLLHISKEYDSIVLHKLVTLTLRDEMMMKNILSTITSKGQVTIPAEVRKHLGLETNDKIVFVIEEGGDVRLAAPRYPDVASLRGAAGSLKKPLSWHEMREIAREDRQQPKDADQP